MAAKQPKDALGFLSAAIEVQKRAGKLGRQQARYLSFYGVCMCLARLGSREALRCCRLASELDPMSPDVWWNLGRVAFALGRRKEAYEALCRGIALKPSHPGLKRALRSGEIRIEPMEKAYGLMSTISLEPEPIPLEVKVVLVGDRRIYYLLNKLDSEFADLFKVVADFSEDVDRDPDSSLRFARLIARIVAEKELLPFSREAVARVSAPCSAGGGGPC